MKTDVNDITIDDFREALRTAMNGVVTTVAPLGFSGDHIYLYRNPTEGKSWSGCVTIRTWSNMPELLIGNKTGKWLCHMKIDRMMGFDYILAEFYRVFENVKHLIDKYNIDDHQPVFAENVSYSAGFAILNKAMQ